MDILEGLHPFNLGKRIMTIIRTDLKESEELITRLAWKERKDFPGFFAGENACVYYKLPYTPPCDRFEGLRNMICAIREKTGLRADFRGVVAIEATEWLGHEQEQYFEAVVKYMADHPGNWCWILNQCTQAQERSFEAACKRFCVTRRERLDLFSQEAVLAGILEGLFASCDKCLTPEAGETLARALMDKRLVRSRSLDLLSRVTEEMLDLADKAPQITREQVQEYLSDWDSTPVMLAGKQLTNEKGYSYEK